MISYDGDGDGHYSESTGSKSEAEAVDLWFLSVGEWEWLSQFLMFSN